MLKAMTTSLAASALLLGLASTTLAATSARYAENPRNSLVGDPHHVG